MNIAWLRNIGDTEDACWVPCAKGDIGAVEFKNDDAPATPAVGGEAELREQLHYMTGTCELAMKHRDIAEAKLAALPPAVGGEDWRDDPSADERWNAGCDFAMLALCGFMDVDPQMVSWDAATETVDGDVRAVIGNILRAKMGEDWSPKAAPPEQPAAAPVSGYLNNRNHTTPDKRESDGETKA